MNTRHPWVILVSALILRLAALPAVHAVQYTSDEREYVRMGEQLLQSGIFADSEGNRAIRAPLYPGMVAALLFLSGHSLLIVHIVGCLLGTLAVWMVYVLALAIWPDRTGALYAAGIAAVYPGLVIYSTLLQTETLYIVLALLALLLLYELVDSPHVGPAAGLGVCAGLAALTRVVFAGFMCIALVLLLLQYRERLRSILPAVAVAAAMMALTVMPWTMRNASVTGSFVPLASGGGNSLLTGNNPYATGTYAVVPGFDTWFTDQARRHGVKDPGVLSETARSTLSARIALEYMASHPLETLMLAGKKTYIFWIYPITHSDSFVPVQALAVACDVLLFVGVVFGVCAVWEVRRRVSVIYAAIVFFWLVQAVLHAEARFRLPLVPLLGLFGGWGIVLLQHRQQLRLVLSRPGFKKAIIAGLACGGIVYGATGVLFVRGAFSH